LPSTCHVHAALEERILSRLIYQNVEVGGGGV
jgi:hypothetical protein